MKRLDELRRRVRRLEVGTGAGTGGSGQWLHLPDQLGPVELVAAIARHRARTGYAGQVFLTEGRPQCDLAAWALLYMPTAGEG